MKRVDLSTHFVAGTLVGVAGILAVHAVAAVLRGAEALAAPLLGPEMSWAAAAVPLAGVAGGLVFRHAVATRILGLIACLASVLLIESTHTAISAAAVAVAVVGVPQALLLPVVAARLPFRLHRYARRRPLPATAWAVLAVLVLLQVGRLTAHMTDPEAAWWITTGDPARCAHQCLPAYIHGADLARQGEPDIYDPKHYPGLDPSAPGRTTVANLAPSIGDPFHYPPQFLLLPSLALALTNDYATIRTTWCCLQIAGFLAVGLLLARWVRGRRGHLMAALLPLVLVSVPALHNFQYGQFHLPAVALAVAGMLAFEARRHALGGALLGFAVASKLFPGVLVLALLAGRRYRPVAWTAGWIALYSALALLWFGPAPFEAFWTDHLPRLQSGAALAFERARPELEVPLIAANQSPRGLLCELSCLGVAGLDAGAARALEVVVTVLLLALAVIAGRRTTRAGVRVTRRRHHAQLWLALLALASMRSPLAFGDYVPVTSLWLLSTLAPELAGDRRRTAFLLASWAFLFLLPGVVPLPLLPPPSDATTAAVTLALALVGMLLMAGLSVWCIVGPVTARAHASRTAPPVPAPIFAGAQSSIRTVSRARPR